VTIINIVIVFDELVSFEPVNAVIVSAEPVNVREVGIESTCLYWNSIEFASNRQNLNHNRNLTEARLIWPAIDTI
jgi:hypothetical protein